MMTPAASPLFTPEEWLRYSRHIQLPQIGAAGQSKLKDSRIVIVGAGGLGSPVSLYMAAAGVGHITLVDHDCVDDTNLQRQILFDTHTVGQPKADAGTARLRALNPYITVEADTRPLTEVNAAAHIANTDLVLDCTDNFSTRYLINDTCTRFQKPWIYASIHQFSGQCALFTKDTACFRCLFPDFPTGIADCNTGGVLGVLPGLLGTLQANEALKFLTGLTTPLLGTLMLADATELNFQKIKLSRSADCCACNGKYTDNGFYQEPSCIVDTEASATPSIMASEFNPAAADKAENYVLDVRSHAERSAFHLGGEHIELAELTALAEHAAPTEWPLSSAELNTESTSPLAVLPRDKTIICYCQSGLRSDKAAKLLMNLGWQAKTVSGGINAILKAKAQL